MFNRSKKEKTQKRKRSISVFVRQSMKDGKNKNTSYMYGRYANNNGKIKEVNIGLTEKEMKLLDNIFNKIDKKTKSIE